MGIKALHQHLRGDNNTKYFQTMAGPLLDQMIIDPFACLMLTRLLTPRKLLLCLLDFEKAYDKVKCQLSLEDMWGLKIMKWIILVFLVVGLCVIDRFEKRLAMWKGKLLSSGGRLPLITFLLNQDGTWQQLLKNKYLGSKSHTQVSHEY
ncbi:hypothetical protein ACJX0J_013027 [Zea mays]